MNPISGMANLRRLSTEPIMKYCTCIIAAIAIHCSVKYGNALQKTRDLPSVSGIPSIPEKGSLVLVANRESLAPIILPAAHTPFMKEAAADLASYIEKISGARPAILEGEPSPIPAKAIWIGYQPAVDKLFPGHKLSFSHPEEVLNIATENHLLLCGRDAWDQDNMSIPDRTGKKMVTGIQQEYGTCNAVYTFIQDKLNVRWFWPGALGEDYIPVEAISIQPFVYRYHPKILDRSGILHLTMLTNNKGSKEEKKWARVQRMQLSSFYLNASHGFGDWWEKFGKTNPDFFALLPNGKREPEFNSKDVKICMSNPDVWNQWMEEVEKQIQKNPHLNVFSAAANDGWSRGHCTCSNCRAWDSPGFDWTSPVLSDREVRFANTLARMLKQKYPGKPYKVLIMAYGFSRPAPTLYKPDENVVVASVSNFLQRSNGFEDERSLHQSHYAAWGKVTANLGWRPNLGNPAGLIMGMPDVAPHQAAEDFRFVAENNCIGMYMDSYWLYWSTQGIQYYSLAQLAWNPYLKIDSLLDDYYWRAYGPAASEMKTYWSLMEDTRNELLNKIKTASRFLRAHDLYTESWFSKADGLLKEALYKVKNADAKFAKRIDFAAQGLSFARLVIETRALNIRWENNKNDSALIKAIDAKWAEGKSLLSRLSPYAVNTQKMFGNPKNSGIRGMHYLNPVDAKTLRRIEALQGYE